MNDKARVETRRTRTEKIAKKTDRVRGRESENDEEREKEAQIG